MFPFVDSSLAPHAIMAPRILTYMGIIWDSHDSEGFKPAPHALIVLRILYLGILRDRQTKTFLESADMIEIRLLGHHRDYFCVNVGRLSLSASFAHPVIASMQMFQCCASMPD